MWNRFAIDNFHKLADIILVSEAVVTYQFLKFVYLLIVRIQNCSSEAFTRILRSYFSRVEIYRVIH